ncbi:hypothetical protein [Mesorhizobium sp. M0296]|uniref:antitoxin Xre/MbcA/ParS-like domain-containing protein n=1 Tax=Mesorhizobium sp. M0296 TaxID=2956931 RepID=UPI003335C62C
MIAPRDIRRKKCKWDKLDKCCCSDYIDGQKDGDLSMANPNMQFVRNRNARVAERVASKVTNALKSDRAFESGSLALSAHIAGAAAVAVLNLPVEARQELTKRQAELMRGVRRLVESFGDDPGRGKIKLVVPEAIEPSKGEGLGSIVSAEEGKRLLGELAVARKIEDWAGPVAGASELSRDYGIPRSTLHRWQHSDEVIGLLKGTKKHVFPVEQFIDGRPARGISAIVSLAGGHRVAWLWLRQANPVLSGRKPIYLLKQDRVDEVVDTARAYFNPQ